MRRTIKVQEYITGHNGIWILVESNEGSVAKDDASIVDSDDSEDNDDIDPNHQEYFNENLKSTSESTSNETNQNWSKSNTD